MKSTDGYKINLLTRKVTNSLKKKKEPLRVKSMKVFSEKTQNKSIEDEIKNH
jgi:hypothetical protein